MLLKLLSCLRYLCRQGLPLRGHSNQEEDSNYIQLIRLIGESDQKLNVWLKKRTEKYTSGEIQNELLKVITLHALRKVVSYIQESDYFTIMADETTDLSNREQGVVCLRWVDCSLDVHEEFVGLHMADSIDANTLVSVIKDVLLRFNLSLNRLRGQCCDGASSMSGAKTGVATQILAEEPKAVYTHCYGHALNLACSDAVKKCKLMTDTLDVTYEITKLLKKSPRTDTCFESIKSEFSPDSPGIRMLCPTSWTVRANALKSVAKNYMVLLDTWEDCLIIARDTETKARIIGVKSQMHIFEYFFGVHLGQLILILGHSDNLSKTLQRRDISAAERQQVTEMTVKTLLSIYSDEKFNLFWQKIISLAESLDVSEPRLPRQRKAPKRFEVGEARPECLTSVEGHFRRIYYEALDLLITCIKNRFDQPGYRIYQNLQELLLSAFNNRNYDEAYDFVSTFYKSDFDTTLLKTCTQLQIVSSNPIEEKTDISLAGIVNHFTKMSKSQLSLLSEVVKLVRLILVMPATNAVSERTFSALRRVKTYLRTTMTQARLNHLILLYVHHVEIDKIDLVQVANDFISTSDHR